MNFNHIIVRNYINRKYLVIFLNKQTMGIKHLRTLLKTICKKSGIYYFQTVRDFLRSEKMRFYKKEVKVKKINNPIRQMTSIKKIIEDVPYYVGIDAHLFASRYKQVFGKIEIGILRQIILSLSSNMIPVYVFDGIAPQQKKKTIIQRQNKKRRMKNKLEEIIGSQV